MIPTLSLLLLAVELAHLAHQRRTYRDACNRRAFAAAGLRAVRP